MPNQHRYDVRIKFEIVRAGKGLQEVQQELDKTEKANSRASKGILGKWTELRSQLLLIKFAVREAAQAVEAFWDASRGGAELTQLTESFERANAQIFKTPGLLDDLSLAARGTVTEAKLMSGIMTVTAGVTREVSQAFTENAGELLNIAKAANRLNPVLGDTDFFYQSLTTGIKRSSYRILDNLGIVVRVGEANRRWADETGRTVESMTAEERQLALLNEVLRVGGRLVDQAGGSSESLTDAYDILTTSIQELKNQGVSMLDEFVRPLIQDFADAKVASLEFKVALNKIFEDVPVTDLDANREALKEAEGDFQEFVDAQEGQFDKLGALLGGIGAGPAFRSLGEGIASSRIKEQLEEVTDQIAEFVVAEVGAKPTSEELIGTLRALGLQVDQLGIHFGDQIIQIGAMRDAVEEHGRAQADAAYKAGAALMEQVISTDALTESDWALIEAQIERERKQEELAEIQEGLTKAQEKASESIRKELGITDVTYWQLAKTMGGVAEANEYLNLVYEDSKQGLEEIVTTEEVLIEAQVRQAEAAREAAAAERQRIRDLIELNKERLAQRPGYAPDTGAFFTAALAGDLNYFTTELDNLGDHLVWVTDSTVTHQEQVENLGAEYEDIANQIHEYETFARGATLSDEERAEKIGELYDELGILADRQAQLGDIQGHYVETTRDAVFDTESLKTALLEAAEAEGASAVQMAIMGQVLGEVTPEMALHALQIAIIQQGIEKLAENYVNGTVGAGSLAGAIDRLMERAAAAENPIKETSDEIGGMAQNLLDMKGLEDIEIPVDADTSDADTAIGATQLSADELVDEAYDIRVQSNALTVKEEEVDVLAASLGDLEIYSPFKPTIESNADDRIEEVTTLQTELRELDKMTIHIPIIYQYQTQGQPPSGQPGIGHQYGADYIIPPGYPNDTFGPIWATSGERVIVDPNPGRGNTTTSTTQNTFSIDARGATPGMEDRIRRAVEEAMMRAGQKADLTRRTL